MISKQLNLNKKLKNADFSELNYRLIIFPCIFLYSLLRGDTLHKNYDAKLFFPCYIISMDDED